VWDQNTYNLYPTFANGPDFGAMENKLWSSDELNREITHLLSEDPEDLAYGKEWESEEEYLTYLKVLVNRYYELFSN